ncbi:MAG: hypothetical protein WCT32_00155 [Patescibacteria group bacterium]
MDSQTKHHTFGKTKRKFLGIISVFSGMSKKLSTTIFRRFVKVDFRKVYSPNIKAGVDRKTAVVIDEAVDALRREADKIEAIDRKIIQLQQSGKTSFKSLNRLHVYLSMRSKLYHRLHAYPYFSQLNISALLIFIISLSFSISSNYSNLFTSIPGLKPSVKYIAASAPEDTTIFTGTNDDLTIGFSNKEAKTVGANIISTSDRIPNAASYQLSINLLSDGLNVPEEKTLKQVSMSSRQQVSGLWTPSPSDRENDVILSETKNPLTYAYDGILHLIASSVQDDTQKAKAQDSSAQIPDNNSLPANTIANTEVTPLGDQGVLYHITDQISARYVMESNKVKEFITIKSKEALISHPKVSSGHPEQSEGSPQSGDSSVSPQNDNSEKISSTLIFSLNSTNNFFFTEDPDKDGSWLAYREEDRGKKNEIENETIPPVFRLYAPTIEDAKKKQGKISMTIEDAALPVRHPESSEGSSSEGTNANALLDSSLSVQNDNRGNQEIIKYTIDPDFLATAEFPITVDPNVGAGGVACTWQGIANAAWTTAGNWDCGHAPAANDDVIFDGAVANTTPGNGSAALVSTGAVNNNIYDFIVQNNYNQTITFDKNPITGGTAAHIWDIQHDITLNQAATGGITLVFSGDTTVNPTDDSGSVVTPNGCSSGTPKCGRGIILKVANDVTVGTGAKISADGKGFAQNTGPGSAGADWHAGTYGGKGWGTSAATYGDPKVPLALGSGGDGGGAAGGGAIRLAITGSLTQNGTISANGAAVAETGSGGSVSISANSVSGNGTISANGGNSSNERSGGGGRVAIIAATNTHSGTVSAYCGTSTYTYQSGAGTVYKNTGGQTYGALIVDNNNLVRSGYSTEIPTGQTWQFDTVTVDRKAELIVIAGTTLIMDSETALSSGSGTAAGAITNRGTVTTSANFSISKVTFNADSTGTISGLTNLTVAADGILSHSDNSTAETYKIDLTITGDLTINGIVNVDGLGYDYNQGPNTACSNYCGGSYGGKGGQSTTSRDTYGSVTAPVNFGSGGSGGSGGGAIKLTVSGALANNGSISSNGLGADDPGAGGSVYITAGSMSGSGTITANGRAGQRASGGGRISITATTSTYSGTPTAYGAVGSAGGTSSGGAGTVYQSLGGTKTVTINNNAITTNSGTILPDTSAGVQDYTGTGTWTITNGAILTSLPNSSAVTATADNLLKKVKLSVDALTVDATGKIDVTGKGYGQSQGPGYTAGKLTSGYGGVGVDQVASSTYGSVTNPISLGSGSSRSDIFGGGAIILNVTGQTNLVTGSIVSAGGQTVSNSASCSGGTVNITSGTMIGGGTISANAYTGTGTWGAGGGRIAITLTSGNNTGSVAAQAYGGSNGVSSDAGGGAGTIYKQLADGTKTVTINNNGKTVNAGTVLPDTSAGVQDYTGSGTWIVTNGGILTHYANSTDAAGETYKMNLLFDALTVDSTGKINVDGKGYSANNGPGKGSGNYSGGSYGGRGGNGSGSAVSGSVYGSSTEPVNIGSGGVSGTAGGGAIKVTVSGALTNNGAVSSIGGSGNAGNGSGGSVYLIAASMSGTGTISATGGVTNSYGAGGGGRIALSISGTLTQGNTISANGGSASSGAYYTSGGAGGSVYINAGTFEGAGAISANGYYASNGGNITIVATTTTYSGALTVTSGSVNVNAVPIVGMAGVISLPSSQMGASGNLTLGGAGNMTSLILGNTDSTQNPPTAVSYTFSSITINSGGTLVLDGNASTNPDPIPTGCSTEVKCGTGGSITATNITINSGGTLNADGKGFAPDAGPGKGVNNYAGGSYGGRGGNENGTSGPTYGTVASPLSLGSGGRGSSYGGGAIKLTVSGILNNNGGTISANGVSGNAGNGSGGSIFITANQLTNSGTISAVGGTSNSYGGGGGGRIAVIITGDTSFAQSGTISVNGGTTGSGVAFSGGSGGSIYMLLSSFSGSGAITANGVYKDGSGGSIAIYPTGTDTYSQGSATASKNGNGTIGTVAFQHVPAVTFSSPADTATNVSQLPTISFTATDSDNPADWYRMKVEIATDSGFTANAATFTQANDTNSFNTGGYQGSYTGMNYDGGGASTQDGYTSGTAGTFTFTSALTQGQAYYVRLSSCDPSGACGTLNQYSTASTRSFTIAAIDKVVFTNDAKTTIAHTVSTLYTAVVRNAIDEDVTVASQQIDLTSDLATNGTTRLFCSDNSSAVACKAAVITSITLTNVSSGTFYFYDETVGSATLTADPAGQSWTNATQAATITADVASRIQLSISGSPASTTTGATLTGTITAYDQYDNTATDYTGDKSITFSGAANAAAAPGGGTIYPTATDKTSTPINFGTTTTTTFTSGVSAATSIVLKKTETISLSVTDGTLSDQSPTDQRYSIQVRPGNLDHYGMSDYPQAGTAQFATAGFPWNSTGLAGGSQSPYDIVVTTYDAYSNLKYDYSGPIWFSMDADKVYTFPYDAASNKLDFTWSSNYIDGQHDLRTTTGDTYDNGRHIFDSSAFTVSTGGTSLAFYLHGKNGADAITPTNLPIKIKPASLGSLGIAFSPAMTTAPIDSAATSDVIVTAYDVLGNVKTDYTGQVYFTSTDSAVTLPNTSVSKYTFQVADLGAKTFDNAAFIFGTGGNHRITVTDDSTDPGTSYTATTGVVVVPTHAPSQVSATAGHESVTLAWTNTTDAAVSKMNIYQSTTQGELGTKLGSQPSVTPGTVSQYAVTGLTNGTTYYFTLKSVHLDPTEVEIESAASTQVEAMPADIAPRSVTAIQQSTGKIKVDYGLRYDSAVTVQYYNPTTATWHNATTAALSGDVGAGITGSEAISSHTLYYQIATDYPNQYFTALQGFKIKVKGTTNQGTGEGISNDLLLDTKPPRVNNGESAVLVDATGDNTATITLLAREDGATEQAIQYRISNNQDMSNASEWATLSAKPTTVSSWSLGDSAIIYVEFKDPYNNVLSASNAITNTPTDFALKDGSNLEVGTYRLMLIWTDPDVSNFANYTVERSLDGSSFSQLDTTTKNGYLDVKLNQSQRYYYRVKTADTLGNVSRPTAVLSSQPGAAPDVTASPTITLQNWKQEYGVRATVTWNTDQLADSFVVYSKEPLESGTGTTTTSGTAAQVVGQFDSTLSHSVLVQQLEPSTKYYFKTLSQNEVKITGASEVVEVTTPERVPLTLSSVTPTATTNTSTTVTWTTNKLSTTVLEYGTTTSYGSTKSETNQNTDHAIKLEDLSPGTTYHVRIKATDADENTTTSDDYAIAIPPTPTISGLKIEDLKPTQATITWTTNVNADSKVSFGPAGGAYTSEQGKSDLTTLHSVTIIGLESAKSYHYQVKSTDSYGNVATSSDATFTAPTDTTPPVISTTKSEVTTTGSGESAKIMAIITWETDEPSTSQVEYGQGISDEYQSKTEEVTTFNMTHTVIIPDIRPNASYQFRIISKDASGNMTKSQDQTIITPTKEKSLLQLVVKSLEETFSWTKRLKDAPLINKFRRN